MQIRTIRKGFEVIEWDSNHSKGFWSIRMQIRTIRKEFKAFECKFEPLKKKFESF